jgi:hypothetical protein
LAQSYNKIGLLENGLRLRKQVYNARCNLFGLRHPETLLAKCHLAESYSLRKHYADAYRFRNGLRIEYDEMFGPQHSVTLREYENLGRTCFSLEKYTEALQIQHHVLKIRKEHLGTFHLETLDSLSNIAKVILKSTNPANRRKAVQLRREILQILEEHHKHPGSGTLIFKARDKLATTIVNACVGTVTEEIEALREAIDIRESMLKDCEGI